MRIRLKLRTKLILSILAVVFLAYSVSIYEQIRGVNALKSKYAEEIALRVGKDYSLRMQNEINSKFIETSNMAKELNMQLSKPVNERPDAIKKMLNSIAEANPSIASVWVSIELRNMNPSYTNDYGRVRFTYFRENGALKYMQDTLNLKGDDKTSIYYNVKVKKTNLLTNPYWYSYNKKDSILETSIGTPMLANSRFIGLAGFDISLESFQTMIASIKPMKGAKSFILSADGSVIAANDSKLRGKKLQDIYSEASEANLTDRIALNKPFGFEVKFGELYHYAVLPVYYKSAKTSWAFGFAVPSKELLGNENNTTDRLLLFAILSMLVIIGVIWYISFKITQPLYRVNRALKNLAEGKIDETNKVKVDTNDELHDIAGSTNELIDSMVRTVEFTTEVGKGNTSIEFKPKSDNDLLGISLLNMKQNLEEAKRLEGIRKIEDEKISWATHGVALFGELLRHHETNLEDFSYHIISNLIDYIKADVGGLFLINDHENGDRTIDLMACYAYDRRKYEEKSLLIGEGLVGRCVQENETIFITDVPESYITIGSGLGENKPSCILIVPLKLNDEVYGVLELASFEVFEKHVIDFVEKIGVTIASTISTTRINIKTQQLLEASKYQAEELSAQEEEMRQNMEELLATQEEAARKSKEIENLLDSLSTASNIIEYDIEGYVMVANDSVLNLLGMRRENLIGLNIREIDSYANEHFNEFWNGIKRGIPAKVKSELTGVNSSVVLYETFIPVADEDEKVYKIMVIGQNIDEFVTFSEKNASATSLN
jgi:methyl-accepting chemotaxis protein